MQFRPLGKTGLNVSILGFGASPLGGEFGAIDEAEGIATVHAAFAAGVNFYDVSPYYGRTKAESVLGRALADLPRAEFVLATKVGRYDKSDFDFSAARVERSLNESLQRLQTDYVDLLQCHDIEFVPLAQIVDETLPALRRLQQQGRARYIGITGLPLAALSWVLERAEVDTVLSYCHYTLNDTAFNDLFSILQARGVGVINASPLSMGLLTDSGPPAWHPAPASLKQAAAQAAALCRERGGNISTLALQFALVEPAIATTLVGMPTRQQLQQNLACMGVAPDPTLLAAVQNILHPVHNLTWPSGLPEKREFPVP